MPAYHADRLAELARRARRSPADAVEVVKLPGVNHLLVRGKTGELDEYPSLSRQGLDPRVAQGTIEWLSRVLPRGEKSRATR